MKFYKKLKIKKSLHQKFSGFLLVNKPEGLTSHDVVSRVKKLFLYHKVGHAGSLDPIATGVLLLGVGSATKQLGKFIIKNKEYQAKMCLGITTDTQDISGKILKKQNTDHISMKEIQAILPKFIGNIEQIPPMFSAKKINGQPLYKLARKGLVIERNPVKINIYELKILSFQGSYVDFFLSCSKGTYVRTICHDIGQQLGTGGCLSNLVRLKIGNFSIKNAHSLKTLAKMDEKELKKILMQASELE